MHYIVDYTYLILITQHCVIVRQFIVLFVPVRSIPSRKHPNMILSCQTHLVRLVCAKETWIMHTHLSPFPPPSPSLALLPLLSLPLLLSLAHPTISLPSPFFPLFYSKTCTCTHFLPYREWQWPCPHRSIPWWYECPCPEVKYIYMYSTCKCQKAHLKSTTILYSTVFSTSQG